MSDHKLLSGFKLQIEKLFAVKLHFKSHVNPTLFFSLFKFFGMCVASAQIQ